MANTELANLKSTAGTINHLTKVISDSILSSNEELSRSPTSFINLLLDQIGTLNAINFYESLSIKQEAIKSTAKTKRSLVRFLNSTEFKGIYGKPASFTFSLGFRVKDIIETSVMESTNLYKLTINRDSIVAMLDKPSFSIDNNIDIYARKILVGSTYEYRFFAKYDIVTGSVHSIVSNPFIKSFLQYIDGEQYFIMNLNLKQYTRSYNYFNALNSGSEKYEFNVQYVENLYAFEVLYKPTADSEDIILVGEPDGVVTIDGYNFSISENNSGNKSITIKFNRNPSYFHPVNGSSINIVLYTTTGTGGNFTIANWNDVDPQIRGLVLAQDMDNIYQKPINNLIPIVTIADITSSGGKGEMTIDELRDYVNRKDDIKLLTIPELENAAKAVNLRFAKERFDILEIYYKLSSIVKTDSTIIDTTSGLVELDIKKLHKSITTNTNILSPLDILKFNSSKFKIIDQDEISPIANYIQEYNKINFYMGGREFFFPFFMRLDLTSYVDAKIYDMSINETKPMIFEYYNSTSTSEASIDNISIIRDPLSEEILYHDSDTSDSDIYSVYRGKYTVSFNMQINELIYNSLDTEDVIRIYIKLIGKNGVFVITNDSIITTVDDTNNIINVRTEFYTDCGIDDYNRLAITEGSIQEFPRVTSPYSVYLIDEIVDMSVFISFKGTTRSNYDDILTTNDKLNGFEGVSAVYTIKDIQLIKNITNTIKPIVDIKVSKGNQLLYTENIPETYEEVIFEVDGDGNNVEIPVTLPDGTIINTPKILHNIGDIVHDVNGNIIYRHIIGTPILDDNGYPRYTYPTETVFFELRDFPLVDRIFSEYGNYINTINAFKTIINKIEAFQVIGPTGSSGKLGVLNTTGAGEYYFINRKTGIEERLDRLSLSFSIGIKLLEDNVDTTTIFDNIRAEIVKYINDRATIVSTSFMEMMDYIKDTVFGIKYYELYKVNNYDEGICHSIYTKDNTDNYDIVTVKNIAYLENDELIFKPDIKLTVIP